MAEFDPVPPPLALPAAPPVLSPNIPLNPPMVGEASPWLHVDGQNRDLILEAIRTWVRVSLLPWTTSWQDQLTAWETATADQLDAWMLLVDAYVTEHAVAGLSFRSTETPIANAGTTNVVLVVDTNLRPIVIGDLVLDQAVDGNYGIITAVIDDTHATVAYIGSLRGPNGLSFRVTASTIAGAGTSDVVLPVVAGYAPLLGDLVINETSGNFGQITAIADPTHATVTFLGAVAGPAGASGLSIRYTASAIAGAGSSDVVLPVVVNFPAELGDLVLDTGSGNAGTITVVTDATHVSVTYVGNLKGVSGTNGSDGIMSSVVAGANVFVDNADPANPVVSAVGAWTFTDPDTMNSTWAGDGNPVHPSNGDIGVLAAAITAGIYTQCIFVYDSQIDKWSNPQVWLSNNNPTETFMLTDNWDNFIVYMNLGTRTRLDFTGATFVETINNSHPVWNAATGQVRPDKTQLRPGIISNQAPGGSVVKNSDGSFALTACTTVEVDRWFPTLLRDGTDQATLKLSGTLSANGTVHMELSQYNNGPDASNSYGGYGRTLKYTSAGTLAYDTDYASPGANQPYWGIVGDAATGTVATVVEAEITIKNIAANVAALAKLHSVFRASDWSESYERDFTYYNILNVGGANPFRLPDGVNLIFSQPFTGTIRLVSNF